MTVEQLLALLSPTTLVNLLIDLDDADGERTPDEVHVMWCVSKSVSTMIGEPKYRQLYSREKERREHVVRSVR